MFHSRLMGVYDLVVVSGAVLEQQRVADVERSQRHEPETRAAQLDARQNEARAIDLKSIGKPSSSDGQASGFRDVRFHFVANLSAMDADTRRETEDASRSEAPTLNEPTRRGSRQVSTALLHACALVRWWS